MRIFSVALFFWVERGLPLYAYPANALDITHKRSNGVSAVALFLFGQIPWQIAHQPVSLGRCFALLYIRIGFFANAL